MSFHLPNQLVITEVLPRLHVCYCRLTKAGKPNS